ncbi:uncharacterized protein LOC122074299 [Macadamia integrifolia]|uniref:uncharacterized protein LOC122074299 n=1 Tax=Macadamia integrifolia TaxID=60698 RepID=UPI001C4F1736|nr:uncharacterized protein LOC122074299 [Macadamia integrifolia]
MLSNVGKFVRSMSSTAGKVIRCRAAVAWEAGKPLSIEELDVAPPKAMEVRLKVLFTSLCHTDVFFWEAKGQTPLFPRIYGHEAGGIVESVGEGVTDLKPGDHVLPVFTGECKECPHCKSEESNMCDLLRINTDRGVMIGDGNSRFSINGKPVYHFLGTSTFSEYTVCHVGSLAKINPSAPLDKVCILSCGISTGLGATLNVAKPKKGSTVAVFGLGAVGLAAAEGAKIAGASRIIGIDVNPKKFDLAKKFGVNEFVNPKDHDKPIEEVLAGMTNGGVDRSIECTGNNAAVLSAFECLHDGWGVGVLVGAPSNDAVFKTHPGNFLNGRTLKGTCFGNYKPRTDLPSVVEKYMNKELELEKFITHEVQFSEINKAFDYMLKGEGLRCIIHMEGRPPMTKIIVGHSTSTESCSQLEKSLAYLSSCEKDSIEDKQIHYLFYIKQYMKYIPIDVPSLFSPVSSGASVLLFWWWCKDKVSLNSILHLFFLFFQLFILSIDDSTATTNAVTNAAATTDVVAAIVATGDEAAVAWEAGKPLSIQELDVAPPKAMEVRLKVLFTSLCHTDVFFWEAKGQIPLFPRIYGHEAGGIVESVGEGVTDLKPGDHVLPVFTGECKECPHCKSEESNMCDLLRINTDRGVMIGDGNSRFSINGKPVYHFLGTSTFSEYTVCHVGSLAKINPSAPLDKVCILSCGISTGLGATLNVAKPKKGSTVAVFGLGAVGLAAAEGARIAGASRIIGIDVNPKKFDLAKKFGVNEFVNPKDHDKPIEEVLAGMTNGGVDRSIECTGNNAAVLSAFECPLFPCYHIHYPCSIFINLSEPLNSSKLTIKSTVSDM